MPHNLKIKRSFFVYKIKTGYKIFNDVFLFQCTYALGTIKAALVVVPDEDNAMQLLLNENSYTQRDPNPKIEFDFVEKTYTLKCGCCSTMTTFNVLVYVSQLSQIQFEDEDHAVYISVLQITVLLI